MTGEMYLWQKWLKLFRNISCYFFENLTLDGHKNASLAMAQVFDIVFNLFFVKHSCSVHIAILVY